MEVETEQVKQSNTPSPPAEATEGVDTNVPAAATSGRRHHSLERGSPNSSIKRNGSLRRDVHRKGSLRRDQRTGEKRRSRTGSLGSLVGYEAKFPVSIVSTQSSLSLAHLCRELVSVRVSPLVYTD